LPIMADTYTLWWRQFGILYKGFIVLFSAVIIYSVATAGRIAVRARSIRRDLNENALYAKKLLTALSSQLANLRQLTGATFYLFCFLLFVGLQGVGDYSVLSKSIPVMIILDSFRFQCAFAAKVFFVFLILHLVWWAVGAMLDDTARRVGPSSS